jgi:hypothetical protein
MIQEATFETWNRNKRTRADRFRLSFHLLPFVVGIVASRGFEIFQRAAARPMRNH